MFPSLSAIDLYARNVASLSDCHPPVYASLKVDKCRPTDLSSYFILTCITTEHSNLHFHHILARETPELTTVNTGKSSQVADVINCANLILVVKKLSIGRPLKIALSYNENLRRAATLRPRVSKNIALGPCLFILHPATYLKLISKRPLVRCCNRVSYFSIACSTLLKSLGLRVPSQ